MKTYSRGNAFIWLLVVVALVAVAFYIGSRYSSTTIVTPPTIATSTVTTTTGDDYTDTASWQTYSSDSAGFSISYPLDFPTNEFNAPKASTDWLVNNPDQSTGLKVFTLTIPKVFEPQTNFAEATLSIGYSKNTTAVRDCLIGQNGEATSSTKTIGGATFTVFTLSDAGAGNLYDTTSYRGVYKNTCYAVEYTIHSSQLANYPASYNLQQFDEAKVQAVMDRIVGTFTLK